MLKNNSRIILLLTLTLLISVSLSGCDFFNGNGNGTDEKVLIEESLREFEKALNSQERDEVLNVIYDEPDNNFWNLTLWADVEKYEFDFWDISINNNEAHVVLNYTVILTDDQGTIDTSEDFRMKQFSSDWKVNLSDFTGLD